MALVTRVYFNAVFGALGGLLGWMLFSIFNEKLEAFSTLQQARYGVFIGAGIGYFVVSVEAIRDHSWLRFVRLASVGVVLGAAGGALGMVIAEGVNYLLVSAIGPHEGNPLKLIPTVFVRGLGLMFLGAAVGASEGIAARSRGKFSYGLIGGTLGGLLGGMFFGLVYEILKRDGAEALPGAGGIMIMGACIGSLSALVQGVFQPASVKVMRGWQEGREYPLDKNDSTLGRDEHADIALFRDMKVEKKHAIIQREGNRYLLINTGAPAEYTRVNEQPVQHTVELKDGDRVQLGNVILRFQMREAVNRQRSAKPPVPAVPMLPR